MGWKVYCANSQIRSNLMKFTETKLKGAFIIEIEPIKDERGFFARTWCKKKFSEQGLNTNFVQCNISFNKKKGTIRGMHYQDDPYQEAKLVRCTRGSIFDVIIDMRPESKTYKKWISVGLSPINLKMLYIPEGFAHGFQTLEDNTEVFYQMSEFYHAECAMGISWREKDLMIEWPIKDVIISVKDQNLPSLEI